MIPGALAGAGLFVCCAALARVSNLAEAPRAFLLLFGLAFVCYGLGAWVLTKVEGARAIVIILGVGVAARLILLPAAPTLSTDVYRYVWDARVSSHGIDPYAFAANAPELTVLRDGVIYPRLNHPSWRTVYPPAAELFFRVIHAVRPDSVAGMKVALGLAEALGVGLLFGLLRVLRLPGSRAVIYAWNPLVLVEIWGMAHLDGLVVPSVVGAAWASAAGRPVLAGAVLGVGAAIKLYPAALVSVLFVGPGALPALAAFVAVVIASYVPALAAGQSAIGSLSRYLTEEYFNPGLARSIMDVPWFSAVAALGWIIWVWSRRRDRAVHERAVLLIGGLVLLSPNLFPWYVLWLVPFLAAVPSLPWIGFSGSVAAAYAFFLADPWAVPSWARVLEFAPLGASVMAHVVSSRTWLPRPVSSA